MAEGIAREGWDADLLFGQAREDAFVRTLLGGAYTEHKADQRARQTGNLFIEFETSEFAEGMGRKRPSGVGATTSDRWAQEFWDGCWVLLPTPRIMELVEVAKVKGKCVWGGDFNRSHGALIPWRWLLFPPSLNDEGEQLSL